MIIVLLVLLSIVLKAETQQNMEINNKCTYATNKQIFTCDGINIIRDDINIGLFLNSGTHILTIKNSNKIVLNSNHHHNENYKDLVSYNIENNKEFQASSNAFKGLSNLHYMKISENNWLLPVKDNTFNGLKNLEVLELSKNNIEILQSNCFNGLMSLRTLDLTFNKIETLPSMLFRSLHNLESLFLEHNVINTIENNAFLGLTSLSILDLSYNSLKVVETKQINLLTQLSYLYLGHNQIESIKGDFTLGKLQFLHLQHNRLRKIDLNLFKHATNLREIDLSNNLLQNDLSEAPFFDLLALQHLNLNHNNINISLFKNLRNQALIVY